MRRHRIRFAWIRFAVLAAALALAGCGKPQRQLVVYTAAEADQLPAYEAAFRKAHPDIAIAWVRDSTGVVTAKLLAERKAPQADVVFALAATSMIALDDAGLLLPYTPEGFARLDPRFTDTARPPHWDGEALWSSAICVNTREMAKRNLPVPETWEDLTKPIYRGLVSMPDPGSSGTGLLTIAAWLQMWGEKKGWDYMDRLDKNIASYSHSGSKPCKDAARGEIPIGISFDFRAAETKDEGAPIAIVIPREGVGWDIESSAVVKGRPHTADAEAFVDWAMSDAAMRVYAKSFAVIAVPSLERPVKNLPAGLPQRLARTDLRRTARQRDRIIAEWTRRYESKTEPGRE